MSEIIQDVDYLPETPAEMLAHLIEFYETHDLSRKANGLPNGEDACYYRCGSTACAVGAMMPDSVERRVLNIGEIISLGELLDRIAEMQKKGESTPAIDTWYEWASNNYEVLCDMQRRHDTARSSEDLRHSYEEALSAIP